MYYINLLIYKNNFRNIYFINKIFSEPRGQHSEFESLLMFLSWSRPPLSPFASCLSSTLSYQNKDKDAKNTSN